MITGTKPAFENRTDSSLERRPNRVVRRAKSWAFNWRLLIASVVLVAAAAPLVYFWHAYQVDRNASALLVLADRCEQREEWMQAAENLHRYLQLRPADVENVVRMAEDVYQGAKQPLQKARAAQLYGRAIALAPDRADLQRRQMALRLEVGDHRAALDQAKKLIATAPDDAEALRVQALALHQQKRLRRSVGDEALLQAYHAAIDRNPRAADLAGGLALFYRNEMAPTKQQSRADLERLADDVMDRFVTASDQPAQAYVARHLYRRQFNLSGASDDLDHAMVADAKKETFDVWWLAGVRAEAAGEHVSAIEYFQDAIEIDASDRRGHLALGNAHSNQGDDDLAIQAWQRGLAKSSAGDIEFELLIAAAKVRQEEWEWTKTGLQALEKKIAPMTAIPRQADLLATVYLLQGEAAIGQKRVAAALGPLKQALALRQAGAESLTRAAAVGQVQMRLGQCYSALGQWDQAALAYQRAADLLPRDPKPRLAAAASWEAAGRYDEAVHQYDDALLLKGAPVGAWVAAANAEYLRQLSLPRAQRDWQSLTNLIIKARQELTKEGAAEPLLLLLVESEWDAENGLVDQAVDRCRENVEQAAMVGRDLVRRLVFDYERWRRADDADRLIERHRATSDDPISHVLLASELQFRRNRREEAYRLLTAALSGAGEASRRALQERLAIMYLADAKADQAKPLLESLAKTDKTDVRALQFLAELDLQAGKIDDAKSHILELEAREGSDGVNWRYYRAQQLMLQANGINKTDPSAAAKLYQRAVELQEQIQALRPVWAPAFLLKARLAAARPLKTSTSIAGDQPLSDDATAILAYVQAIRLGARSIPVYESLILLLYRQNRISEADVYLSQLREIAPLPDEISPVAMAIDVRQGNLARAIATAREQVGAEPNDAMRHLRLGMLLAREGDASASANKANLAEAELELKRSRELSPSDSRGWAALLSFYIGSEQTERARNLLAEVRETKALGSEETPFFLAQGYAAIGDEEQATTCYVQSVAAANDRAAVQFQSGVYFFKRDPQLARKCLRRTLAIDPSHRSAAELLAVLLASHGGAEQEIDQLLSAGQIEPKDRRLHAMLLLRRGGTEHRRRAQEILEALAGDARQAASLDHLLLARLYETEARLAAARGESTAAEGSMAGAREQYKALVNIEHPAPEHLAAYIDNLLRSGRAADAAGRLDDLARLEPETSSLRTLSLRLRWFKEQKQDQSIQPLIDSYVESRLKSLPDKPSQARALQAAAEVYSTYHLLDEAEKTFRRAIALDASATAALVEWLNRHDRTSDAVQLCIELAKNDSTPLPAMILCNLLAIGKPTDEDSRAAQPVIDRALVEHADNSGLLFTMSIKHLMDGDNEESIRLLRRVLKLEPRHVTAMNNLAVLLSMKPDGREEAAKWMATAIDLAGGNPELVDSKGWVLMQQQKLPDAVEAFQEALAGAPGDARYHFHLALAYQLQGKLKEARNAFEISRRSGLDLVTMPPDERSALSRLETALQ